jgi:hypothetical protein
MSEHSNQELLRFKVIEASIASTWEDAKLEWSLDTIYDEHGGSCECGHHIVQHCIIRNDQTDTELIVGNVCINHFDVPELYVPVVARGCLKRVREEIHTAHANQDLLEVAFRLDIISELEWDKYEQKTTGRGSRTRFWWDHPHYDPNAVELVEKINHFIVLGFRSNRPRCRCGSFAKPRQNGNTKDYFYSCARFRGSQSVAAGEACGWSQSVTSVEIDDLLT